uniref:Nucleolar 27S pre-rRNA processing Urb2/Npa2 C-terminal domain-containing protein n=1 Tax=Anopheles farauti TaxID=69004 RepID=A0A182QWA0_9DIPT
MNITTGKYLRFALKNWADVKLTVKSSTEIIKRLTNEERGFHENLSYGIKLWKSSGFYYMSKYDITFNFLLQNMKQFFDEHNKLDEIQFNERWEIINTFLSLPCPSNALPLSTVTRLKDTLQSLAETAIGRKEQLLESLFIVAFDSKYKNFYKFDFHAYGSMLRVALDYYKKCLEVVKPKEDEEKIIDRIFSDIRIYHKSASADAKWRNAFDAFVIPLSEVVLLLEKRGVVRRKELLDLFQQVYFTTENVATYNRVTEGKKQTLFMGCFDLKQIPLHVIALLMEGFLRAYRDMKLEILLFLKYFMQHVFVNRSILNDSHQVFALTKYVFALLRKYFIMVDQQLMVDFNFTEILTAQLKEQLERCAASEQVMRDFCNLICTINAYNPLILEHSIVDIILKMMFVRKDAETLQAYQQMLESTVNMFVKLNKSENLRDELFMKLSDYLEENGMDDVIRSLRQKPSDKRKSVSAASEPPRKKKLNASGIALEVENLSKEEQMFWVLLFIEPDGTDEPKRISQNAAVHNVWPRLDFAWPDTNGRLGEAMKEYTKQLLTKRSLSYWKQFMMLLNDIIELEEPTEGNIFQLELALCWMCYFFAGNTLIEHSNLFWTRLTGYFDEFDQILSNIGRRLIADEDSGYTGLYGAFLNVVYYYGNYRLMVLYYRPDSIEECNYEQLHAYLTASEWSVLEKRVSQDDLPLLNRVRLQKLRLLSFSNNEQDAEGETSVNVERQRLMEEILKNATSGATLRPLLLDRSTNVWFLGLMDEQRRKLVAERLLDPAYCPLEELQHMLAEISSDQELIEVFLHAAYKKLTKLLTSSEQATSQRKLSLHNLFEQDESVLREMFLHSASTLSPKKNVIQLNAKTVHELEQTFAVLDEIRMDLLEPSKKSVLVAVHLLLLATLNACDAKPLAQRFEKQLIKFLLLGTVASISQYVTVEALVRLFGLSSIVNILIQQLVENLTEEAFEEFKKILGNFSSKNDGHFELLLVIYTQEQRNKSKKRASIVPDELRKSFLDDLVATVDTYLLKKDPLKQCKKDAAGFIHALKACAISFHHKASHQQELSEELRDQFLLYIQQALTVEAYNSDMLLTRCLTHKDYLNLDGTITTAIKEKCWQTFLSLMQERTGAHQNAADQRGMDAENLSASKSDQQTRHIETIINALVGHFTEQQYMDKLNQLNRKEFIDSFSLKTTMAVFGILSKKGLQHTVTPDVCKVFVRSFATVVARDVMELCVLNKLDRDRELLTSILECFSTIVANQKLALFPALLDYVLQVLSAINIGKQSAVPDGEESAFFTLHHAMAEIMYCLVRVRPNYVSSRLPSYVHVYQGLLGALLCYKGDRLVQTKSLSSFEILTISDLLLPLQRIVNIASKKLQKHLYLLAPYVLAQILHTIVQCKRATTEHNRIASSVHSICFSLIAILDSHAPAYLLRTLDESSRLLFTDIKKRYERSRGRRLGGGKSA